MRRITTTCWASFWPKYATSGATMLNSLQTTVQTPSKWPGAALGALEHVAEAVDARPSSRSRRGRSRPTGGANSASTPSAVGDRGVARLRARVGGEVGGLVELRRVDEQRDDDVVAALARGAHQRLVAGVERAHRRHEADAAAGARAPRRRARGPRRSCAGSSSRRSARAPAWRRRARRTAASRSGVRSATAARWRATVASSPRAIGPGERVARRRAAPSSRPRRGRAARAARGRRPAVRGEPLRRALERDEEVRRDRGGRVVGGAVLVGDRRRAHARAAPASSARDRERARRASRRPRAPAPANARRAARRARSSAGAARTPRAPASTSSPVAPEQWPTAGPAHDRGRGARSRASGTHSSTASTPPRVGAAAERAVDVEAGGAQGGGEGGAEAARRRRSRRSEGCGFRSSSRMRYRLVAPSDRARKLRLRRRTPPAAGAMVAACPRRRPGAKSSRRSGSRRRRARGARSSPPRATTVVFGAGNADADLMFVGEAPGRQRGQAGPAVRRPGRAAARHAAGRDRPRARRRVHREHAASAGRPATAIRCRARSTPARTTCSASSS